MPVLGLLGGPVVKTPRFYRRGNRFHPWLGNSDSLWCCCTVKQNKTKQNKTQNPNHLSAPLLSPYLHNFVLLFSSLKCLLVSFALKIQQISSQCQVQVSLLWSLPSQYYCLSSPSIYNWGLTSYYRIVKFLNGKDAEQIFTFRAAK